MRAISAVRKRHSKETIACLKSELHRVPDQPEQHGKTRPPKMNLTTNKLRRQRTRVHHKYRTLAARNHVPDTYRQELFT